MQILQGAQVLHASGKAERLVQCDDVFGDGKISCFVLQIVQSHRGMAQQIAEPSWKFCRPAHLGR